MKLLDYLIKYHAEKMADIEHLTSHPIFFFLGNRNFVYYVAKSF